MKKKRLAVFSLLFVLVASSFAYAATPQISREYSVSSKVKDSITISDLGKGDLSEVRQEITVDGKKYTAEKVSLQKEKSETKTYTDLTEKKVPKSLKTEDGKMLSLSDVKYKKEIEKRSPVSGTLTIEGSAGQPEFPQSTEITASLPTGESITVTGYLQSVERSGSSETAFTMQARFEGDPDVQRFYLDENTAVPNTGSAEFDGFEEIIAAHLGLDDSFTIQSGAWDGGYVREEVNGSTVTARYASYSGTRIVPDWIGHYRENLTEDSPNLALKETYSATAKYGGDKAIVTVSYAPAGLTTLQKVLIGSAAALVLIGLVVAILLLLKKRRKEEA